MERFECIVKTTIAICLTVVLTALVVRTPVTVHVEDCVIHTNWKPIDSVGKLKGIDAVKKELGVE